MTDKILRLKDIKAFMLYDLNASSRYVRAGFLDVHKADRINDALQRDGLIKLNAWLCDKWEFITTSRALNEKTFEDLLNDVNGPKKPAHNEVELDLNLLTANFHGPDLGPREDKVTINPVVLEWINDHANPLVCLDELYNEARRIMMKKNHDYTGGSGDPYANFRGSTSLNISPISGILLRVQDKLMRIKTFDEKGELLVQDEGIKDAMMDVINYMALIYGLVKEQSRESE